MHTFTTTIDRLADGLKHHYALVPKEVAAAIKGQGARRVIATINGLQLKRALNARVGIGTILILGQPYLKQLKLHAGDEVTVKLEIDKEPDTVVLAEEFQAVLDTDEEAAALFGKMTPGMRRSLNVYVEQVKNTDSRIKRALELAHKIKTRTLASQKKRKL